MKFIFFFLHYRPDPVQFLLNFNADPHLTDYIHHNTALHWACEGCNHIPLPYLLKAGANVEARNKKVSYQDPHD